MIKVIKHGNKVPQRKTCPVCGCEFEFDVSDLETDYSLCLTSIPAQYRRYIRCPECGEMIYHDNIHDPYPTYPTYPYPWDVIYTSGDIKCDDCSWYHSILKSNKPYVGDSPCDYCVNHVPTCSCIGDTPHKPSQEELEDFFNNK